MPEECLILIILVCAPKRIMEKGFCWYYLFENILFNKKINFYVYKPLNITNIMLTYEVAEVYFGSREITGYREHLSQSIGTRLVRNDQIVGTFVDVIRRKLFLLRL